MSVAHHQRHGRLPTTSPANKEKLSQYGQVFRHKNIVKEFLHGKGREHGNIDKVVDTI